MTLKEMAEVRHAWIISYPPQNRPPWWRPLARRRWRPSVDGEFVAACFCGWEQTCTGASEAQAQVAAHMGGCRR